MTQRQEKYPPESFTVLEDRGRVIWEDLDLCFSKGGNLNTQGNLFPWGEQLAAAPLAHHLTSNGDARWGDPMRGSSGSCEVIAGNRMGMVRLQSELLACPTKLHLWCCSWQYWRECGTLNHFSRMCKNKRKQLKRKGVIYYGNETFSGQVLSSFVETMWQLMWQQCAWCCMGKGKSKTGSETNDN